MIQAALDVTGGGTYLEIGVSSGISFIPTRARHKWGVDPSPSLSWKRLAKYDLFALLGIRDERIFRQTSDRFFHVNRRRIVNHGIDVCFVDGLHTYDQALRDIENAIRYLNVGGYVLAHDCNPESESAAMPLSSIEAVAAENVPGWAGVWNGDVWKAIVHLRSLRDDLRVNVLDCDHGVGIIRRGTPDERLSLTLGQIREMDYADLARDRERLLGLRPPTFLEDALAERQSG